MRSSLLLLAALSGCQYYEFREVEPFTVAQTTQKRISATRRLKPNVMLLVDNSGSMKIAANPADPRCAPGCGDVGQPACATGCPTRLTEMKGAMDSILSSQATIARFGLTVFPQVDGTDSCRAPVVVNHPLPPATPNDDGTDPTLISAASVVNATLQTLNPNGGTPTAAALDFVGTTPALSEDDGRLDVVVLLTDGVPNCNAQNANQVCGCQQSGGTCSSAQTQACSCTLSSCGLPQNLCSLGCLDSDASVSAVQRLLSKGIRTAVVGFGTDLASGNGPAVLKAMADEGGFPRRCANGTNAECGTGVCDQATLRCQQSFYAASNRTELEAAISAIWKDIGTNPCLYTLDAKPDDQQSLAVLVDSQVVSPGDASWTWDARTNSVNFTGALCDRLMASTVQQPIELEFRIVERL
jgi:hypothetical protein